MIGTYSLLHTIERENECDIKVNISLKLNCTILLILKFEIFFWCCLDLALGSETWKLSFIIFIWYYFSILTKNQVSMSVISCVGI